MQSGHKRRNLVTSGMFLISFLITFAVFVEKLELHKLLGFDMSIIRVVQARIDNQNTRLMKRITDLGSPFVISLFVVSSCIFLYRSGRKRESLGILMANIAGAGFNTTLKYIFRRQRPYIHRLVSAHGYSFPSGHSMGSVIFYGTISHVICRPLKNSFYKLFVYATGAFMVLMTGVSRIYLGVHYPSDVLSGYAAGGAWLSVSMKGFNAMLPRR